MNPNHDNDDDFILVLGTSPDQNSNMDNCSVLSTSDMQKSQMEDALKEVPKETKLDFKTHFHFGETPSPASMEVATGIITDGGSIENLQKRFAQLLDENMVLKDALKDNNESMRVQFTLITSCQEDMMKTHEMHREKFDETRELVERLRKENKQLKFDIMRQSLAEPLTVSSDSTESKSGPSSELEFVSSPEDDTIDKLTAQLELVEKQRRQLVVDNEKLAWQKSSLEQMVDGVTKDNRECKTELNDLKFRLLKEQAQHRKELKALQETVDVLQDKLEIANKAAEVDRKAKQDQAQQTREQPGALAALENELRNANIKIVDLENIKCEFTKYMSTVSEIIRVYKQQIQEMKNKIKEMQTWKFEPVGLQVQPELQTSSEYMQCIKNAGLYDQTLKQLSTFMNGLVNGLTDGLASTLGVITSLYENELERAPAESVRVALGEVCTALDKQHAQAAHFVGNIQGVLSIFQGIFKDYNEVIKKYLMKNSEKPANIEHLTAALVARGHEVTLLQARLAQLEINKDEVELLRAQAELYKSDFVAERECREQMACEKEVLKTDLRGAQRRIQELTKELTVAAKEVPMKKTPLKRATVGTTAAVNPNVASGPATVGTVFTCPKCSKFSSTRYDLMEEHFDVCLDG